MSELSAELKCPDCKQMEDLIFDSKGEAIACKCGWNYLTKDKEA